MFKKRWLFIAPFSFVMLLVVSAVTSTTQAQEGGQNPTPIVITVTPLGSPTPGGGPTAVPSPTGEGSVQPDRFEPNNEASAATEIGLQTESGLTLTGDDMDYFTGYLKAGQMVRVSTTVYEGLDTRLKIYWDGQLVARAEIPIQAVRECHGSAAAAIKIVTARQSLPAESQTYPPRHC